MVSTCRYSQGALVVEVERTTSGKSVSAHTRRRLEYVPSSQAGARLPHFPIDIRHHMAPSSSSKVGPKCPTIFKCPFLTMNVDHDLCTFMHVYRSDTSGS